jgi:hypothetical protein
MYNNKIPARPTVAKQSRHLFCQGKVNSNAEENAQETK